MTFQLGPDDPATRETDVLNRLELARNIESLIKATPENWTVRVGVYGRWGEGKTSVLRLVESLAQEDSMICVRLNPSLVADRAEFWNNFLLALQSALGVSPDALNPTRRFGWHWSRFRARAASYRQVKPVLETVRAAIPHSDTREILDLVARTADSIRTGLAARKHHVEALLASHLGKRRLVVFIDDLDRTDPGLVPHVLLGVRELDVANCAVVVAIDPEMVSEALRLTNPAWGNGTEFISKILQYHFWLTPLDRQLMEALAEADSTPTELGIPIGVLADVMDLLPKNPRRFKEFLRRLSHLGHVLRRHDPEEIEWQLLLLFEVLRARFPVIVDLLLRSERFRQNVVASMFGEKLDDEEKAKHAQRTEELTSAVESVNGSALIDRDATTHLVELILEVCKRASLTTSEAVKYWGTVHESPPVITRKELREILMKWLSGDRTPQLLDQLLSQHTKFLSIKMSSMGPGFLAALVDKRREELGEASNTDTEGEMEPWLARSEESFEVLTAFIRGNQAFADARYGLGGPDLVRLYEHFAQWADFTNTDDYRRYRQEEHDLLLVAAGDASAVASAVIESLHPWLPAYDGLSDKRRVLRERLLRALSQAVVRQVRARFSIPEGISVLWNSQRYWAEKWVLFSRQDVFDESFRPELQQLAIRAQEDLRIQKNFLSFVRLLADGLNSFIAPAGTAENVRKVVQDQELMAVLWRGATSRPLQPRVAGSLVAERSRLVSAMDNKDSLPMPRWLQATTAQDPVDTQKSEHERSAAAGDTH